MNEEHKTTETVFKYSFKKLLIRKLISLFCLAIFVLLSVNEPFWHLRQYVPDSVAYILNGPPQLEHYMTPEQIAIFRDRNNRDNRGLTQEEMNIVWAFYAEYGSFRRPSIWYLEIPRRIILGSLFVLAIPLIVTDIFANKRVHIRLTKKRLLHYDPWIIIPIATEKFIDWDKVISIKTKRNILGEKVIVVRYTYTEEHEHEEKEHAIAISDRYTEASRDDMLKEITTYFDNSKEIDAK